MTTKVHIVQLSFTQPIFKKGPLYLTLPNMTTNKSTYLPSRALANLKISKSNYAKKHVIGIPQNNIDKFFHLLEAFIPKKRPCRITNANIDLPTYLS